MIADQLVGEFTDAVASDAPTPGGGAVVGAVAALAAALAGMVGRYSLRSDPESVTFTQAVEQSDQLRARASALADADADAYAHYLTVVRGHSEPEARKRELHAASDSAANVPFDLGGVAAEIADLAERLATEGNPRLRSDACTSALLAAAVAASTALLVQENLTAFPGDARLAGAAEHARDAAAAAERALATRSQLQGAGA